MKKIVVILSVILLTCNVSSAQEGNNENSLTNSPDTTSPAYNDNQGENDDETDRKDSPIPNNNKDLNPSENDDKVPPNQKEKDELNGNETNDGRFPNIAFYILCGFAVVLLILLILLKISAQKLISEKESSINKLKQNRERELWKRNDLENKVDALSAENESLREENQKLKSTIYLMQHQNVSHEIKEQSVTPPPSYPQTFYADSIIEGKFNKITNQANVDTVFELLLKKADDRNAEFTIYENAKRRVLKNADFIDGCEKQRINSNPVDLQVENGIATLQDNGKWQITQKAKIKFI
ncbi:MAG: hypothetical protein LBE91_07460 [Tannerella sp.]|jgi:cell division protein FtsB|nr:hypothetical protein [Tannerella sp.]